jgi:hypothetical protein
VARSAGLRKAIRAHIAAGGLAVAGIAGLGVAYLFPLIIAASSKGGRTAAATTGLIALGSLAFAIVVWLVFYLPVSVAAGMIAKKRSARLGAPLHAWLERGSVVADAPVRPAPAFRSEVSAAHDGRDPRIWVRALLFP